MQKKSEIKKVIKSLLQDQNLGVLATGNDKSTHTSLMSFAATSDLKYIYFYSKRATKKYQLLMENKNVSFLVDNRINEAKDFYEAKAVSIYGKIIELEKDKNKHVTRLFTKKGNSIDDFMMKDSVALLEIKVSSYSLVQEFEKVVELDIQ